MLHHRGTEQILKSRKKTSIELEEIVCCYRSSPKNKPLLSCCNSQNVISSACIFMFPFLIHIYQLDAIRAQHLTPKSHLQILARQNWEVYSLFPSCWKARLPGVDFLSELCPMVEWADMVIDKRLRPPSSVADIGFTKAGKLSLFCILNGASVWSTVLCVIHGSTSTPHTDFIRSWPPIRLRWWHLDNEPSAAC